MRCPYVQPEWFCEKAAGHDGPHEMYVAPPLVTASQTDRQPHPDVMAPTAPSSEVQP